MSSLGDPDGLTTGGLLGLAESVLEERLGLGDVVGHRVLEVGVGVHTNPVTGINDGLVGSVVPGGPGVNVTNGGLL